jgi:hypothetical protein
MTLFIAELATSAIQSELRIVGTSILIPSTILEGVHFHTKFQTS